MKLSLNTDKSVPVFQAKSLRLTVRPNKTGNEVKQEGYQAGS